MTRQSFSKNSSFNVVQSSKLLQAKQNRGAWCDRRWSRAAISYVAISSMKSNIESTEEKDWVMEFSSKFCKFSDNRTTQSDLFTVQRAGGKFHVWISGSSNQSVSSCSSSAEYRVTHSRRGVESDSNLIRPNDNSSAPLSDTLYTE